MRRPAHAPVVANLGRITDPVQLDNLKAAFAANRTGERLVPVVASAPEPAGGAARPRRPQAILRYLDVAVVVEILRQLGLASHRSRLLSHHRGLLQLSFGFPSAEMGCTRHFGARGKRARG